VACAVSAALDGRPTSEVLRLALRGAKEAEKLRPSTGAATSAASIEKIHSDLVRRKRLAVDEVAQQFFPDRTETIVPLAISLSVITQSAEGTAVFAANLGGDSDSVASIGAAIAGAVRPETVNERLFEVVSSINDDGILAAATSLAAMRMRR
jgi:ADP-ribosylglycohydrolase